MAPAVTDSPTAPSSLAYLEPHLPRSLPVLRRLQFTGFPNGTSEHAHYLHSSDPYGTWPQHFAAAYLDFSKGPETEMWFYSTLENGPVTAEEEAHVLDLICALFRRVKHIAQDFTAGSSPDRPGKGFFWPGVMVGCLDEGTRQLLLTQRGFTTRYSNPHDKWLFRVENLPSGLPDPLSEGLRWDVVKRKDVPTIIARTGIPKVEATLMSLPSTAVRDADGQAVSWAFMGLDGTLSTLHVEEPHRKKGIAKAVAIKVLRDHAKDFGNDGWAAADVHTQNVQSQGVCKSIGGTKAWLMSWSIVDFDSIPDSD